MGLFDNNIFGSSSSIVADPLRNLKLPNREDKFSIIREILGVPNLGYDIDELRNIPGISLITSLVDHIRENVIPKRGSILHCSLYGVEHTGIYLENNRIVDLSGDGSIRLKKPEEFIAGTSALAIYVACTDTTPLYRSIIADRAEKMIGSRKDYHLLMDNCHRFTGYCVTGEDKERLVNTFSELQMKITSEFNITRNNEFTWRVWEQDSNQKFITE